MWVLIGIEAILRSTHNIPYDGIFSRRQIFAVFSKKHGDYFSRILIFAVGNIPILFCENFEWVIQLDFPSIDQLCGKKISGQSIWNARNKRYLQSYRQTNKNNRFTFKRLKKMTVQNKTMKSLSCLLVTWTLKVESYDTFCHTKTRGVFWI